MYHPYTLPLILDALTWLIKGDVRVYSLAYIFECEQWEGKVVGMLFLSLVNRDALSHENRLLLTRFHLLYVFECCLKRFDRSKQVRVIMTPR